MCGGSIRKHSVPKFELDFCPDHWGSPFGLKLHETSSYVINDLHRKRNISRTFALLTTSGNFHRVFLMVFFLGQQCILLAASCKSYFQLYM